MVINIAFSVTVNFHMGWVSYNLTQARLAPRFLSLTVLVSISGFHLLGASSLIVYFILLNQRVCISHVFFLFLGRLIN